MSDKTKYNAWCGNAHTFSGLKLPFCPEVFTQTFVLSLSQEIFFFFFKFPKRLKSLVVHWIIFDTHTLFKFNLSVSEITLMLIAAWYLSALAITIHCKSWCLMPLNVVSTLIHFSKLKSLTPLRDVQRLVPISSNYDSMHYVDHTVIAYHWRSWSRALVVLNMS